MTMLSGVDVASMQSVATVRAVAAAGASFGIVKATEGRGYVNPLHTGQVAALRAAHRLVGHYHFAWFGDRPSQEVAFFLGHALAAPGDLLALDVEFENASQWAPIANVAAYALEWLTECAHQTGASPLLYGNKSTLKAAVAHEPGLRKFPLWVADPDAKTGHPDLCTWPIWTIHQYGTAGHVDRNVFNGDAATWDALAIPHRSTGGRGMSAPIPTQQRKFSMLVFALGDDYSFATGFRKGVITRDISEAKAAIARGDKVLVIGGPAATALGLSAGVHGNTTVAVGKVYHDSAVEAAKYID